MSECYVCTVKFTRLPEATGIPYCSNCQPKSKLPSLKQIEKIAVDFVKKETLKPVKRRFHAKYVKSGNSLPSQEKVLEEWELKELLWEGEKFDKLPVNGNGPHRDMPGNIFWQEVTDDPKASAITADPESPSRYIVNGKRMTEKEAEKFWAEAHEVLTKYLAKGMIR